MNKERKLEESILAYCRTLDGTVGMRDVPSGLQAARDKGHMVALVQLGTWGAMFDSNGDPTQSVIKTAKSWEALAQDLGLS